MSDEDKEYVKSRVEELLSKESNFFFFDELEVNYKALDEKLKSVGYDTYLIDLRNPERSDNINLLSYIYDVYHKDNNKGTELIFHIAEDVCIEMPSESENALFTKSAADYLAGLIVLMFNTKDKKDCTLKNLYHMMTTLDKEENINELKKYINTLDKEDFLYKYLSGTLYSPADTRLGIIQTAKAFLNDLMYRTDLIDLLSTDGLNITDLDNKKVAIFFMGNKSNNKVVNMLVDELICENKPRKRKLSIFLDNFELFPYYNNIDEITTLSELNNIDTYLITTDPYCEEEDPNE